MDSRTLRSIIYDLKTKNPDASYETISSMVFLNCGVDVSRQHCRTAYVKERENRSKMKNDAEKVSVYIVHLRLYGYTDEEIIKIVKKERDIDISSEDIEKIFGDNEKYSEKVFEDTSDRICKLVESNKSPYSIFFDGYKIKKDIVNNMIAARIYKDIMDNILKENNKYFKYREAYRTALINTKVFINGQLDIINGLETGSYIQEENVVNQSESSNSDEVSPE